MTGNLNDILDVFKCCILTWSILTTMVPAFILAGAIATFVPADKILRYLGHSAKWYVAYPVAAVAGVGLSLCSCNIVPLFISIYRRGAGIGPASTFLYAGPAINVLSMIFVFQVIGVKLGIVRIIGVPVIALIVGFLMALIWGRSERERAEKARNELKFATDLAAPKYIPWLLGALLALMIAGALPVHTQTDEYWRAGIMGLLAVFAGFIVYAGMTLEDVKAWGKETWGLLKMIVPILVPAVVLIAILATQIDLKFIHRYLSYKNPWATTYAGIFGSLMYFPILTEVAFTKAFIKNHMDVGPAFAILLTGAGLSLPGMVLVARAIGVRRTAVYVILVMVLCIGAGYWFDHKIGPYLCACQINPD